MSSQGRSLDHFLYVRKRSKRSILALNNWNYDETHTGLYFMLPLRFLHLLNICTCTVDGRRRPVVQHARNRLFNFNAVLLYLFFVETKHLYAERHLVDVS